MTNSRVMLTGSQCFLHDVHMPDWERLGKYVVARRVNLGFDIRPEFAAAAQITTRVLSDIENGKRGNYDKVTIAKLEAALGWETGSVERVAEGGEPWLKEQTPAAEVGAGLDKLLTDYRSGPDEALGRVMRSDLPDAKKRQIMLLLIAEKQAAERRRAEQADELIRLVREDE